jgi:hypothetical protein
MYVSVFLVASSSGFPSKTLYAFLSHACYVLRLSHTPWLDHCNNIRRGEQVVNLLIMQFSPLSLPPLLLLPLWNIGHQWNASFHFSFLIRRQSVGLLGRGISPSQGRYLYKHRINTNIHALSGIRTHVRRGEDDSCFRPRGHCDRQFFPVSYY